MPVILIVLAVLALVLYIAFHYFISPSLSWDRKAIIAAVIVVLVLLLWFVLPLRLVAVHGA
jgi:membrane-bound acyltransferase YfiQ involved in biofilm formation